MRGVLWIVMFLALATSVDASVYDGHYTNAFAGMLFDIARSLGVG
ncbi:MAG TPA: hypothetical protein VFL51_17450 [Pseudolabrys sp.]|nr:hypothetical protein [Pseudolabrys sp.]